MLTFGTLAYHILDYGMLRGNLRGSNIEHAPRFQQRGAGLDLLIANPQAAPL